MDENELYNWLCEMNDQEMSTSECEYLDRIEQRLSNIEKLLLYILQNSERS